MKKLMNKLKIKKGAALIRVSTKNQALTQNGSLDAQGHIIERWRNNLNFCGDVEYQITEWIEEEQSAFRDKNLKRKELLRLMEKIQSRRIDFIVFERM